MTERYLRIKFPDADFDVPAKLIAEDRASHYAKLDHERDGEDYEETFKKEVEWVMAEESGFELYDWASNNMDWSDVKDQAIRVEREKPKVDYEREWSNVQKEVVDR